ncbi:MAG TPA: LuxR C-terminal-related transcriptional regulator, partial [Ktedonosporobacter sp.]|nr:LuxR C-terminal-related transcriptional regulator [Ktedonosporobacter sp.]
GAPLLTLLYQLHDELRHRPDPGRQAPTLDYLARLILLYKQEQQTNIPPSKPPEQSLVEPLSGREMEVLWHISAGRSNREIAGQLVVALSTVKSHIRAIYAKLEVKSRTQALARAHSLKLL